MTAEQYDALAALNHWWRSQKGERRKYGRRKVARIRLNLYKIRRGT